MKNFKFLKTTQTVYVSVGVEYTANHNTKSFTHLRFANENEMDGKKIEMFCGTFLEFKMMIVNHPRLCWYSNKPIIHRVDYVSKGWNILQYIKTQMSFRRDIIRFKKNQNLRIHYEI